MKTLSLIALSLTLTAVGCATEPTAKLDASHPAHADAKQAACCDAKEGKLLTASHNHAAAPAATAASDPHAGHAGHADHATPAASADAAKDKPVPYPLTTCLVSGEDLGSMGKPYGFVHEGRQIMLCCKACEKEFKSDTAKFIKKFDDAVKAKK